MTEWYFPFWNTSLEKIVPQNEWVMCEDTRLQLKPSPFKLGKWSHSGEQI